MASTFILSSGSATVAGVAFTSVTSVSYSETGTSTTLSTDGSRFANSVFVDNKTCTVTVNVSDMSIMKASALRVGKTGAAVIKGYLRNAGDGEAATNTTLTFATMAILGIDGDIPSEGVGSASIRFQSYTADNSSIVAWS